MDRYGVRDWTVEVGSKHPDFPELTYCTLRSPGGNTITGYVQFPGLLGLLGITDKQKLDESPPAPEPAPVATSQEETLEVARIVWCQKAVFCTMPAGHEGICQDDLPF